MVPLQESSHTNIMSHKVHIPVGHWRDGLCNCCLYGPCHNRFCMAWCCPLGTCLYRIYVLVSFLESAALISMYSNLSRSSASRFPFETQCLGQPRHNHRSSWSVSEDRGIHRCLLRHLFYDLLYLLSICPRLPSIYRCAVGYPIELGICLFAVSFYCALECEIPHSQQVCHPRVLQYRL